MITLPDLVAIGTLAVALVILTPLLGGYLARVLEGEPVRLSRVLGPLERGVYRACGIDPTHEQRWTRYALSLLAFSSVSILALYLLQRLQGGLPLNPTAAVAVGPALAFNTAVSFVTNTDWQNYAGESTMAHLTQMAGITVQMFVSSAAGIAVAIALVRGLVRRSADTIGSFWVDLVRVTLYVLLPLAFLAALALVADGVVQTLAGPAHATGLEGAQQTIALGPIASQEAIKELGTNGGGFLNANSAHPFENPTALTDWLEILLLLAIPFALTATFGRMTGDRRQGWVLFAAMAIILVGFGAVAVWAEGRPNPLFPPGIDQAMGNLEGKEVRFGPALSAVFATATTGTSTGAVNAMHASFTPLGGLVPLTLIMLGEIVPGGTGSGLYGMLVFAMLAVFLAGLMVGRTPEYLGKKVEAYEMKMSMLFVLVAAASICLFTALGVSWAEGLAGPATAGPHGFSEILYAFSSQTGNNGSAFGSLSGNTPFYNVAGALAMLIGRFGMIVPVLAIAGSMARKRRVAPSAGTFPTTGPIFVGLLIGVILIVGALTYFPALALGPIAEELAQAAGRIF
ncbi:MAG: potassium-transporting ATPase subunit KdpA [Chloroflexota bacterium]